MMMIRFLLGPPEVQIIFFFLGAACGSLLADFFETVTVAIIGVVIYVILAIIWGVGKLLAMKLFASLIKDFIKFKGW
tara:strand:+ start:226 stop:456 length:231 start_codon:yes stop_codon:yes gene_type:complete